MVNNYIRIGFHPKQMTILTFNDKDRSEVEQVKQKVYEVTGGRSSMEIALWKTCSGLDYPLVGELRKTGVLYP
jgi:hypothetical protein